MNSGYLQRRLLSSHLALGLVEQSCSESYVDRLINKVDAEGGVRTPPPGYATEYAEGYTVLCAKRGENGLLHTLGIISVILHAIHTQDTST